MKTELIPGEAVFFQYRTPNTTITILQRKNPSTEVVNGKAASNIKHLYRVLQSFPSDETNGKFIELNSVYEMEYEKDTYIVVPWNNTSLINREQKIVGKDNLGRFIEILTDNIDKKPEEAWKLATDLYKYEKLQVLFIKADIQNIDKPKDIAWKKACSIDYTMHGLVSDFRAQFEDATGFILRIDPSDPSQLNFGYPGPGVSVFYIGSVKRSENDYDEFVVSFDKFTDVNESFPICGKDRLYWFLWRLGHLSSMDLVTAIHQARILPMPFNIQLKG